MSKQPLLKRLCALLLLFVAAACFALSAMASVPTFNGGSSGESGGTSIATGGYSVDIKEHSGEISLHITGTGDSLKISDMVIDAE